MHKVGRRKSSVANIQAVLGTGKIVINKQSDYDYFQKQSLLLSIIYCPLKKIQAENKYDFYITVSGGGNFSQAYAIRLGIARALTHLSDLDANQDQSIQNDTDRNTFLSVENAKENKIIFKQDHFLTRDPRVKERRKYGLKKARRASQFSKR
nr:ribosomal protein S9 [Trentepohlia sp. YN1242]